LNLKKILVGAMLMASAAMAQTQVAAVESADISVEESSECTTGKPGPDWVCVGGGWLPPGMPLPGGAIVIPPPAAPTAAGCTTPQPGSGWICVGGGWLPPGMPLPGGALAPPPSAPPAAAGCTTPQPGSDWSCVGGGWLPPGMTPPGGAPVAVTAPAAQQAAPGPVMNSSGGGGQVRIMTWNIHFGEDGAAAQAREIANSGADVVLLQEAQTWDEHMPTTYPERLRQLTGQTWHTIWSEASNPSCGGGCQGTLILSRLPIVTHQTVSVSGTTATRAVIDVSGVHINVFNIHLEYYDTGKRSSQLVQFMDWMKQFGGPQIAGGDFNSWWGEWWIQQMETAFSDTWQDVTGSDEDGYTVHGTVRFDYLFRSHQDSWRITPTSAWVRWTGLSDHAQLVADYIVR
jgi:endonuclease/exonuclease/phosphatase family metal-dependent hydrolase